MVDRSRLRLLLALAAAAGSVPIAGRAATAPPTRPDAPLEAIMLRLLAGDTPGALAAARALQVAGAHPQADALVTELTDLARGGYASRGNRSFAALAPSWRRARARWLDGVTPPAGTLPDVVVSLAAEVTQVVAVDVAANAAWLVRRDAGGGWSAEGFYAATGANGAGKRRRGDLRTPLGVYWINDSLDTGRLPVRYGSRVLALDYPNALDRLQDRRGDGIWIHGIDPANNVRPPRDTDGCVALMADRIGAFADAVALRETPVVIGDALRWTAPSGRRDGARPDLDAALESWRERRAARDAGPLLAMYADEFTRFGMSPALWRSWRRRASAAGDIAGVGAERVSHFVADPAAAVYVSRFRQVLQRGQGRAPVVTWQRLYWQEQKGRLRIVAQSAG